MSEGVSVWVGYRKEILLIAWICEKVLQLSKLSNGKYYLLSFQTFISVFTESRKLTENCRFMNLVQILLNLFREHCKLRVRPAVHRNQMKFPTCNMRNIYSACENVRENFEEIWPRLDRLGQIWYIGRLGPMLFRAPESLIFTQYYSLYENYLSFQEMKDII